MSDQIILTGIRGYGYHGLFDFEAEEGQIFLVDLTISIDLTKASLSDQIADTVDYGAVAELVLEEIEGERVILIERLAGRIGDRVLALDSRINSVEIIVHKPQAPVKADLTDIAVKITRKR
jgi:dihydroneopterin aldolase